LLNEFENKNREFEEEQYRELKDTYYRENAIEKDNFQANAIDNILQEFKYNETLIKTKYNFN